MNVQFKESVPSANFKPLDVIVDGKTLGDIRQSDTGLLHLCIRVEFNAGGYRDGVLVQGHAATAEEALAIAFESALRFHSEALIAIGKLKQRIIGNAEAIGTEGGAS